MSYSVGTLPAYVKQPAKPLIYAKLFNVIPTLQYCNEQTGIKSSEAIQLLSSTAFWQSQACSFSASGTDTITQRTIVVGKPMVQKKWCERDLEAKYTQQALKAGGSYTSLAYNTEIIENTMQDIQKNFEQALWQGVLGSGTHNLGHFDGFNTIIAGATIGGTFSGTSWSKANSRTVMTGLADLVIADTDVWRDGGTNIKFFCSPSVAQAYRSKLVTDNIYHITGVENKLTVEGTDIEIVSVPGLAGLNYIYAIEPENMYFGTDMSGEAEKFKVWYSEDNMEMRFHTEFKAGVQIAFPSRVYKYLGV